jgi:hypothetical protein
MAIGHWKKLIKKIKEGSINERNFIHYEHYFDILQDVINHIQKYGYYVIDGRLEDCLIKHVCTKFEDFSDFIDLDKIASDISSNLKKLIVPNIILIPMNHMNKRLLDKVTMLDDNISLFSMSEKMGKIRRDKSLLSRYVEKKIYCKFGADHILITKDPFFFNYPILGISIKHIEDRVEHEAPKIVESVYSLIRMLDFREEREPNDKGWGVRFRDNLPEAFTYTVYYKKAGSDYNNLNDGELGYSFRFKFSPILDINTISFIKNKDRFTSLIKQVIEYSLMTEIDINPIIYRIRKKWISGINLFNTVYEFVSIGKHDAALLLMFSILESLFFKLGDYNRKDVLIERLEKFLKNESDIKSVKALITTTSNYRNMFVHQGIGLERFKTYRSLNDREGYIQGQKPFIHSWHPMPENEFKNYYALMTLVIYVLINDTDKLFDFYVNNVETQ